MAPLRLPKSQIEPISPSEPLTAKPPVPRIPSRFATRESRSLRVASWRPKRSSAIRPWVRTSTPHSTTFPFRATPVVRRLNGTHPPGNRVSVCWRKESWTPSQSAVTSRRTSWAPASPPTTTKATATYCVSARLGAKLNLTVASPSPAARCGAWSPKRRRPRTIAPKRCL